MIIELSRRLNHESEAAVEIGVRKVSFGSGAESAGLHPSFEPSRQGLASGASRAIHSPYRGTPMSREPSSEAQGLQSRCSHLSTAEQTHRGGWCDCSCSKTATATMPTVMAVDRAPTRGQRLAAPAALSLPQTAAVDGRAGFPAKPRGRQFPGEGKGLIKKIR